MADPKSVAEDVAKRIGTTTLYTYVNCDGLLKCPRQSLLISDLSDAFCSNDYHIPICIEVSDL